MPKWFQKWSQNGAKIYQKIDFSMKAGFMKNLVFIIGKNILFEVPGVQRSMKKSIKKRCENKRRQSDAKTTKNDAKMDPTWSQKAPKVYQK